MPTVRRTLTVLASACTLFGAGAWAADPPLAPDTGSDTAPAVLVGDLNATPMDSRHAGASPGAKDEEGSGLARASLFVSLGLLAVLALRRRK